MRHALLALLLCLAAAGCTSPAAVEDVTPAAAPEPEPPTAQAPPTPATPTPSPETSEPAAPPTAEPPAPEPEPPAPAPWTLAGEARLGWAAAVGAGGAVPTQGQTSEAHCPDAAFVVPAETASLRVVVSGEPGSAQGPGGGFYEITLTLPDGTTLTFAPGVAQSPAPELQGSTEASVDAPAAGEWRLRAEPVGPAAQHTWTVALELAGESLTPPAGPLAVTPACSGS